MNRQIMWPQKSKKKASKILIDRNSPEDNIVRSFGKISCRVSEVEEALNDVFKQSDQ